MTSKRFHRLTCVWASVAVVTFTYGCGTASIQTGSTYAYITERQLVVMRADRVVARVPRVFDPANSSDDKVVWTNDGRYVALLAGATLRQEPRSAEELIVVDSATGVIKRFPCSDCEDLTAVEGHKILAVAWGEGADPPAEYSTFDIGVGTVVRSVPFDPPTYGTGITAFLASGSNWAMTTQSVPVGPTFEQHVEMTKVPGYENVSVGYFSSNEYMLSATANVGPGRNPRFAVAFRQDPGECVAQFPITVFEPKGQSSPLQISTEMMAAEPPGWRHGEPGGIEVNDLWWGTDGHLYATIASWKCEAGTQLESEKKVLASHSSIWRLDGQRWRHAGAAAVTMVRQVGSGSGSRVELVRPECIESMPADPTVECNTGSLYLEDGAKRSLLARGVISISAPSPSA